MNPTLTIEGRLGDDPELRFTPSGAAVANLSVVTSDRKKEGDEWVDVDTSWWRVTVWREQAENVAETLRKGDLVLVQGKAYERTWEDRDGNKRRSVEVTAFTVAPSLRWTAATVNRVKRAAAAQPEEDPWAASSPKKDPWAAGSGRQETPAGEDAPPF